MASGLLCSLLLIKGNRQRSLKRDQLVCHHQLSCFFARGTSARGTSVMACLQCRDGFCRTDMMDHGKHVVCARVTQQFLEYSRSKVSCQCLLICSHKICDWCLTGGPSLMNCHSNGSSTCVTAIISWLFAYISGNGRSNCSVACCLRDTHLPFHLLHQIF